MKMAKSRGLTEEPEGGLRCTACFEMRLEFVAEAAVKYGYDYFEVHSHYHLKRMHNL